MTDEFHRISFNLSKDYTSLVIVRWYNIQYIFVSEQDIL